MAEKHHTLSDGTQGTTSELAAMAGVGIECMRGRLQKTYSAEKVLMPVNKAKRRTGWHKTKGRLLFPKSNEQRPV